MPVQHVHRVGAAACCLTVLLLFPRMASAQAGVARPERPNRALFGGGMGATEQSLIFSGQAGSGVYAATENEIGTEPVTNRFSSPTVNLDGALAYALGRRTVTLDANAMTSARYFPSGGGIYNNASSGAVGLTYQPAIRTQISADFSASREPLTILGLLPGIDDGGMTPLVPLDYGVGTGTSYARLEAGAGVNYNLSRQAAIGGEYRRTRSRVTDEQLDRWSSSVLGLFTYDLGRGLVLRAGYGVEDHFYGEREASEESRIRTHRIDAGADYNRSLSFSRRTSLSFTAGSVVMSEQGVRRFDVVGSAILRHEIGRSWYSSVGYNRDLEFVDVLTRPTFNESLTGGLTGLLGRRVSVSADGGASRGEVGVASATNRFVVYRGGTGLVYGLSQSLGLGLHYTYYHYTFDYPQELPGAFPTSSIARHTIRVSVDVFQPLFTRQRRP